MAESKELTLKEKRESAAKKALDGGKGETDPNSDLLIPGTSVTNEEAMRDPDNMPGKVKVLDREVQVASSLIGGETPLEAHKTALDTRDEADRRSTTEEGKFWKISEELERLPIMQRPSSFGHRRPVEVSEQLFDMEKAGMLTLSPQFKARLAKAIEAWEEAARTETRGGDWPRGPGEAQADQDAYEASRKASDIESLLGKE